MSRLSMLSYLYSVSCYKLLGIFVAVCAFEASAEYDTCTLQGTGCEDLWNWEGQLYVS